MTADRDLIAEGRRLYHLATEGNWAIWRDLDDGYIVVGQESGVIPDGQMSIEGEHNPTANAYIEPDADLIVWMRNNLSAVLDKLEQLQRGGKYLGDIIVALNDAALDATGLHHLIDENRDGDWQAVWENVADLGHSLRATRTELDEAIDRTAELWTEREQARAALATLEAERLDYVRSHRDFAQQLVAERDEARAELQQSRNASGAA